MPTAARAQKNTGEQLISKVLGALRAGDSDKRLPPYTS
jgi:hypothetical protein